MAGIGKKHVYGILVMALSSALFSVMTTLIKYGKTLGLDPYRMVLYRFAIGLALLGSLAMFRKIKLEFFKSWLLFFRGFLGGIAVALFYVSVYKLGMAKGSTINYSYPIFATIGGAIFLKEKVTLRTWFTVSACVVGIGLIATSGVAAGEGKAASSIWYVAAVAGAVLAGAAVVMVKKLRDTDSSYAIFYAQCAMGFWLVAIPASVTPTEIGYWGGAVLIMIGLVAAAAQLTMTWAFGHTTVATGSLLGMLAPVFNIPIGMIVFSEEVSGRAVAGIVIVLVSCALIISSRSPATVDDQSPPPQGSEG